MSDKSVCEQYQEWAAEAVEDWDGQDNNDLWDLVSARLGTESPGAENARLRAEVDALRSDLGRLQEHAGWTHGQLRRSEAEVARLTRERDAIQAVAVKLQAYIYTDDTQDRSYDAEALVAVRKKAGLDPAPTEGGTR